MYCCQRCVGRWTGAKLGEWCAKVVCMWSLLESSRCTLMSENALSSGSLASAWQQWKCLMELLRVLSNFISVSFGAGTSLSVFQTYGRRCSVPFVLVSELSLLSMLFENTLYWIFCVKVHRVGCGIPHQLLVCLHLGRHHKEDKNSDGVPPSILQRVYW